LQLITTFSSAMLWLQGDFIAASHISHFTLLTVSDIWWTVKSCSPCANWSQL